MSRYNAQDHYFHKAKKEGYRARSVYKLQSIEERFHLIHPGDRVLDLGAAPGSFLQYIGRIIGPEGLAVGVDLQPIKPFKQKNIVTLVADVMDQEALEQKLKELNLEVFDVITSDMAPSTSGIRFLDGGRSQELNEHVIKIADRWLVPGGHLVMKLLPGVNEGILIKKLKSFFKIVRHSRPSAVRASSGEWYLVAMHRKD